jgi:hypothetical protein
MGAGGIEIMKLSALDYTLANSFLLMDSLAPQIPKEPTMTVQPENTIIPW